MTIEFKKARLPDDLNDLMELDRKIFGDYPDDIFEPEDWNNYESYWMLKDGVRIGCSAFQHNVDYDEQPRPGCLFIASTGILPQFQGKGLDVIKRNGKLHTRNKTAFQLSSQT